MDYLLVECNLCDQCTPCVQKTVAFQSTDNAAKAAAADSFIDKLQPQTVIHKRIANSKIHHSHGKVKQGAVLAGKELPSGNVLLY